MDKVLIITIGAGILLGVVVYLILTLSSSMELLLRLACGILAAAIWNCISAIGMLKWNW